MALFMFVLERLLKIQPLPSPIIMFTIKAGESKDPWTSNMLNIWGKYFTFDSDGYYVKPNRIQVIC